MGAKLSTPIKKLGAWLARNPDTIYTAASDGFVIASQAATGAGNLALALQSPNGTFRQKAQVDSTIVTIGDSITCTIPVKKGETWNAVTTGSTLNPTETVFWIPLE